jgi:hypothetical protein
MFWLLIPKVYQGSAYAFTGGNQNSSSILLDSNDIAALSYLTIKDYGMKVHIWRTSSSGIARVCGYSMNAGSFTTGGVEGNIVIVNSSTGADSYVRAVAKTQWQNNRYAKLAIHSYTGSSNNITASYPCTINFTAQWIIAVNEFPAVGNEKITAEQKNKLYEALCCGQNATSTYAVSKDSIIYRPGTPWGASTGVTKDEYNRLRDLIASHTTIANPFTKVI